LPASGGAVAGGTSSNPLRVDPTGSTTQPANVTQWAGSGVALGTGNVSGGTLRVVLATDQATLTNAQPVSVMNVGSGPTTLLCSNGATGAGSPRVTIASDNSDVPVKLQPQTSGGPSKTRVAAAASTNATSAKASAGQVYGWYLYNNTSSAK